MWDVTRGTVRNLLGIACLTVSFLSLVPCAAWADPVSDGFAAYKRGDYLSAYGLLRPWADHGNGDAEFLIGLMFANGQGVRQSYAEAAQWYQAAADDGQPAAQNSLGLMYAAGVGVLRSYATAAKLYWLAADQGNPRAQYNLAVAFRDGKGVEQSNVWAYMWYTLSGTADWDPKTRELARTERDALAQKMSPDQVAQAQTEVANWKPTVRRSTLPR